MNELNLGVGSMTKVCHMKEIWRWECLSSIFLHSFCTKLICTQKKSPILILNPDPPQLLQTKLILWTTSDYRGIIWNFEQSAYLFNLVWK